MNIHPFTHFPSLMRLHARIRIGIANIGLDGCCSHRTCLAYHSSTVHLEGYAVDTIEAANSAIDNANTKGSTSLEEARTHEGQYHDISG